MEGEPDETQVRVRLSTNEPGLSLHNDLGTLLMPTGKYFEYYPLFLTVL